MLAQNGVRQCDISRRLLITHGCVSKILSKYQRTGRFEAGGRYRGGRRIITTPRMLSTDGCIQEQPEIFPWNIRRYPPCQENLFGADGHRSPSSIRRSLLQTGVIEQREPRTSQEQGDGRRSPVIANILNLSSNEQSTTTSNESQPCQQTGLSRALLINSFTNKFLYFFTCTIIYKIEKLVFSKFHDNSRSSVYCTGLHITLNVNQCKNTCRRPT